MTKKSKPPHYTVSQFPGQVEVSGSEMPEPASPAEPKRSFIGWKIAGVAAVVVALAVGIFFAVVHEEDDTFVDPGYVSPYTWENLSVDEQGRLHYVNTEGESASLVGIDVSEWDTDTDWSAVAADGIDFAIIRIGYRGNSLGGLYEDELFQEAYKGATENGLMVGVYFFSQATSAAEGREEADFVLSILDGRHLDLPVMFDHEGIADAESRSYGLSDELYTAATQAFCSRIEHGGYIAGIYGNRYAIAKIDPEIRELYNVWLAEWDTDLPHAQFDFCVWQFTNAGSVDGMWRRVDTSIWFTKELPLKTPESRAAASGEVPDENQLPVTDTDAPTVEEEAVAAEDAGAGAEDEVAEENEGEESEAELSQTDDIAQA